MPEDPTFYPDDGSVLLLSRPDFREFGASAEFDLMGGRRALPIWFEELTVELVTQYYTRTWSDPDSPPDWGALQSAPLVSGVFLVGSETAFAITSVTKERPAPVGEVVQPVTTLIVYQQARWRYAWMPIDPTQEGAWNFVHLRRQTAAWSWPNSHEDPLPSGPASVGDLLDEWWHPTTLPDFDPGAPLTWPGTDWEETTLPAVATCEDPPDEGGTTTSQAWVAQRIRWPRPDFVAPFGTFHPGTLPGSRTDTAGYENPRF